MFEFNNNNNNRRLVTLFEFVCLQWSEVWFARDKPSIISTDLLLLLYYYCIWRWTGSCGGGLPAGASLSVLLVTSLI